MLCAIYDRQQPTQRMVTAIPATRSLLRIGLIRLARRQVEVLRQHHPPSEAALHRLNGPYNRKRSTSLRRARWRSGSLANAISESQNQTDAGPAVGVLFVKASEQCA